VRKKNTVAVKDGRLRAAARSEGLTFLSDRSKKNNAKGSRQLTLQQHGSEGQKASRRCPV
jgi:hypothetical protein